MRFGEITRMSWRDVDLTKSVVRLRDTKNGDDRTVPLSGAMNLLIRNLGPMADGAVWGSEQAVRSAWRRTRDNAVAAAEAAGDGALAASMADLRFHDLRHEATSRLFEDTELSMMEIAMITGHKTLAMLRHYTHLRAHRLVGKMGPMPDALHLAEVVTGVIENRALPMSDWKESERRGQWKLLSGSAALLRAAVCSKPIRAIAGDLGISDATIHKACARLGVDKPPQGYWLRSSAA